VTLWFQGNRIEVSFRISESKADEVEWDCFEEVSNPDWLGTAICFQLAPHQGGSRLTLKQSGWRDDAKLFDVCDRGWPKFLGNIMRLIEHGEDNVLRNDDSDGS